MCWFWCYFYWPLASSFLMRFFFFSFSGQKSNENLHRMLAQVTAGNWPTLLKMQTASSGHMHYIYKSGTKSDLKVFCYLLATWPFIVALAPSSQLVGLCCSPLSGPIVVPPAVAPPAPPAVPLAPLLLLPAPVGLVSSRLLGNVSGVLATVSRELYAKCF